jgi:hypothetical protein
MEVPRFRRVKEHPLWEGLSDGSKARLEQLVKQIEAGWPKGVKRGRITRVGVVRMRSKGRVVLAQKLLVECYPYVPSGIFRLARAKHVEINPSVADFVLEWGGVSTGSSAPLRAKAIAKRLKPSSDRRVKSGIVGFIPPHAVPHIFTREMLQALAKWKVPQDHLEHMTKDPEHVRNALGVK